MDSEDKELLRDVAKAVQSIDKGLAIQTRILEEHVKADEHLRRDFEIHKRDEIGPLKKSMAMMQGALKFVIIVGAVLGAAAAIIAAVKTK
jgi:hypothetical protein